MKRILYTIAIMAAAIVLCSCESDTSFYEKGDGCVSFNIGINDATRVSGYEGYPFSVCKILIKDTDNGATVRKYTNIGDLPSELWLVEGDYKVEAYLGEKAAQSWNTKYYYGEAPFTIMKGQTAESVNVMCGIYNTLIEVVYAPDIEEHFEEGYRTKVMIGDGISAKEDAKDGDGVLVYTESREGYFNFPDGENKFSFCFKGNLKSGGDIHKEDVITLAANEIHGYRHKITFSYSVEDPDEGYIKIKITSTPLVDEDISVGINPDAVIPEGAKEVSALELGKGVWNGEIKLTAYSQEDPSLVKIQYRTETLTRAENWLELPTTPDGDNYYSATIIPTPNTRYHYRLAVNGELVGEEYTFDTPAAPQIPNSNFETWSTNSKGVILPYVEGGEQWWDTGNHGSIAAKVNITNNVSDAHGGQYSAYLKSQKAAIAGIGKLAAGNIFIGQYIGTYSLSNGCIAFGKKFPYTYKPKKLIFYYKAYAGTINEKGSGSPVGTGVPDVNEVYICLTKMEGPHLVKTASADRETFLTIDDIETIDYCSDANITTSSKNDKNGDNAGHVIAWGVWRNSEKVDTWTKGEIELHYNEQYADEMPNYLMLTASASKYGDYFTGSTDSYMYIDDVEFVY